MVKHTSGHIGISVPTSHHYETNSYISMSLQYDVTNSYISMSLQYDVLLECQYEKIHARISAIHSITVLHC
jgi:hypothetical protein